MIQFLKGKVYVCSHTMFNQFIVQNQEDNFDDADFLLIYNENLDPRENWFGSPNFLRFYPNRSKRYV